METHVMTADMAGQNSRWTTSEMLYTKHCVHIKFSKEMVFGHNSYGR